MNKGQKHRFSASGCTMLVTFLRGAVLVFVLVALAVAGSNKDNKNLNK